MKKRTITFKDGTIVDCGVEEFKELKKAMKSNDSKAVVSATVKVLLSSDKLMDKFIKEYSEVFSKMEKEDKNGKKKERH